eukprot:UN29705
MRPMTMPIQMKETVRTMRSGPMMTGWPGPPTPSKTAPAGMMRGGSMMRGMPMKEEHDSSIRHDRR